MVVAALLVVLMTVSFAACNLFGSKDDPATKSDDNNSTTNDDKTYKPSDVKILKDLDNYAKKSSDYGPAATSFDASGKKYAGQDCTEEYSLLKNRIDDKHQDVLDGESTSAAVKIFALSTPEGLLQRMADAALTFAEMQRVVAYLAGEEDADVGSFIVDDNGWKGSMTGANLVKWTEAGLQGKDPNDGWSLFDDWELYERLKDYADDKDNGLKRSSDDKLNDITAQDTAADNASWQYRSILEKVYTQVQLDGAPAARLATHMLDYAIAIVEEQSGPISAAADDSAHTADFTVYCRTKAPQNDPFGGLGDYDVLVYLLSFYDLYKVNPFETLDGLQSAVRLYGYYYNYNKTYYFGALADRPTYTKQLYYEKLDTYTDDEWADYVTIQRSNYINTYRYKSSFYTLFYTDHFGFQTKVENNELMVYGIAQPVSSTSYTAEMKLAIDEQFKGIDGQLAMSDWMWCYGGSKSNMTAYNNANTDYQKGRISKNTEEKYKGQFNYEFEELKIVDYLLDNMTSAELSGALYYNCYAYSGSMIQSMQNYLKNIKYVEDKMEEGATYTKIADEVKKGDEDKYAMEKLTVLEQQAFNDWTEARVKESAKNAKDQSWTKMSEEIKGAKSYDYNKVKATTNKGEWEHKCEVLEDRVVAKTWSCCNQRVSEADVSQCDYSHVQNADGTVATKEYSLNCTISKFVSDYESILYYIAGQANVEFDIPGKTAYQTSKDGGQTFTTGYYGTIAELRTAASSVLAYTKDNTFTISAGATFEEEILDKDEEDSGWWEENKAPGNKDADYKFDPKTYEEQYSGSKKSYTYTYDFTGWYLDKDCKFIFDPEDDVDFDIIVYAGYNITKSGK